MQSAKTVFVGAAASCLASLWALVPCLPSDDEGRQQWQHTVASTLTPQLP